MSNSAKAKADDQLARESHQLQRQKIDKHPAAMDILIYGAEKNTTIKRMHFKVHLNEAQEVAIKWSDADG